MYCPKCGKANSDSSKFCCNCGNLLEKNKSTSIICGQTDRRNIYFGLTVLLNIFMLLSVAMPVLSVYSEYDYRDHTYSLIRYVIGDGCLQTETEELLMQSKHFGSTFFITVFGWVMLVTSCIFSVMCAVSAMLFLYYAVTDKKRSSLVRASSNTMVFGIVYSACLIIYTLLRTEKCSITFLGITILAFALLFMIFIKKHLQYEREVIAENVIDKKHSGLSIATAIQAILIVVLVGVAICAIYIYQEFKTPLYSNKEGWDIDGSWNYEGETIHFDSDGKVIYDNYYFTTYELRFKEEDSKVHIQIIDWNDSNYVVDTYVDIDKTGSAIQFYDDVHNYLLTLYITPKKVYLKYNNKEYVFIRSKE